MAITGIKVSSVSADTLPSYYSLRDEMYIQTEDQTLTGNCWNCDKVYERDNN